MREIDILTGMSGVPVATAIALAADAIAVTRFKNARRFASHLRSVPRAESSNNKTIIKSATKAGRKLSVALLSQSLNRFRDNNKKLERWYENASVFKKKGVVRMALCRRAFQEIRRMLKKGECRYFRNPGLLVKNTTGYQKFPEKRGMIFKENLQISA
jgi:transposase